MQQPVVMQRLFFMFPTGWPGFGLVLLRFSVAIALLLEIWSHRQLLPVWLAGAGALISAALCAGCVTPIGAAVAVAFHALMWSGCGIDNVALATTVSLDAIALALLGPGAYSVDGYRFGRHVVVLPAV